MDDLPCGGGVCPVALHRSHRRSVLLYDPASLGMRITYVGDRDHNVVAWLSSLFEAICTTQLAIIIKGLLCGLLCGLLHGTVLWATGKVTERFVLLVFHSRDPFGGLLRIGFALSLLDPLGGLLYESMLGVLLYGLLGRRIYRYIATTWFIVL